MSIIHCLLLDLQHRDAASMVPKAAWRADVRGGQHRGPAGGVGPWHTRNVLDGILREGMAPVEVELGGKGGHMLADRDHKCAGMPACCESAYINICGDCICAYV